ncbi:ABC transporter substrate-binding protein [Sulfurospirillum sp. T05]|uniref:ABC transporter substrate-binding protein n=1 Tax=Sulfurospirillum tamanense TaxID=2813362 RepID=A0ABS2WP12_9BACT|nr:ABC transporter substrate-binding protein [Sulfurospirillum tamanensis]MBN2963302.1 ABC transporter substrate-binding protein [Sulfurospirillum tamanensis]
MKRIFIVLLGLSLSLFAAIEKEQIAPIMKHKIQSVTDLLQQENISKSILSGQIFEEFDPVFDFDLMARLSLGTAQWRVLSGAEQKEFTYHFVARLKRSFIEKLELYSNEVAVIKDAKDVVVGSSTRVFLLTELISKEANYQVDYKFYDAKGRGWLIYDVDILGVSIVQTYRSQFEGFLKDNPFEALIGWLQEDLEP